jgi:hypothetical protein
LAASANFGASVRGFEASAGFGASVRGFEVSVNFGVSVCDFDASPCGAAAAKRSSNESDGPGGIAATAATAGGDSITIVLLATVNAFRTVDAVGLTPATSRLSVTAG